MVFLIVPMLISLASPSDARYEPFVMGSLNALPGLGHAWMGMWRETVEDLTFTLSPLIAGIGLVSAIDDHDGDPFDLSSMRAGSIAAPMLITTQNMWFYGMYRAYRDALSQPVERLDRLYKKPFDLKLLRSPLVFLGVISFTGLATGLMFIFDHYRIGLFDRDKVDVFGFRFTPQIGLALHGGYYGILFSGVAVGEEALFRGMIQTEIEKATGSAKLAVLGQSLIFGLAHALNSDNPKGRVLTSFWTGFLGVYMGLIYRESEEDLGPSIAFHYWYDLLLSIASYILDPDAGALTFKAGYKW